MSTVQIRQKLHNYLEIADDKKVKAIYTMMEKEIEQSIVDYTSGLKTELDSRQQSYLEGSVKMLSSRESKRRIKKLLDGGK